MKLVPAHEIYFPKYKKRLRQKMFSVKYPWFYLFIIQIASNFGDAVTMLQLNSSLNLKSTTDCLIKVCYADLSFRRTVILKHVSYESDEKNAFYNEIIHAVNNNNIQLVVLEEFDNLNDTINVDDADWLVVVYFKNCNALTEFNVKIVFEKIKYLIIVSDDLNEDCTSKMKSIGNVINKHDVTFVFNENKEDHFKFMTFIPQIDEETCKEIVTLPKIVNICANGQIGRKTIFPSKNPKDIKKCPINVGMGSLYPFGIINHKEKYKTFDRLNETEVRGLDLDLVKVLVNQFNGTLNLYFTYKKEENPFGQLDFIPLVLNGSLDVIAGGFYRIYGNVVAYSGIYTSQAVTWMYVANRTTKSWQSLIVKIDGLYIFVIFHLIYSCVWYFVRKFDERAVDFRNTILYSWGALVGTTSLQDALSLKQRILNLTYLIMCVHLSAYVSLHLYYFLTVLEPPELLKSNDDVMRSGRPAFLIPISKYFVLDEKYLSFANASEECTKFQDCSDLSLLRNGVTIILQGFFLNYQARTAINYEAKVLSAAENVLTVCYEMLLRKNSPYVERLQKLMTHLFEAGIPDRFYRHAIGLTVIGKAHSACQNTVSNSYSCQSGCKITFDQFAGVFYLWLFGCVLSCGAFIFELFSKFGRA